MPPRKLIAGNWKMNGTRGDLGEVDALVAALAVEPARARVALAPPATLLQAMADRVQGIVELGAQDLSAQAPGAHTGDLAGELLRDVGARFVILGHSERRQDHGEDDALVAAKVRAALRCGLEPLVCVGETLEQREAGHALAVVAAQVRASLPVELKGARFALAYEPVWAIGSGRTPSPEQISQMHEALQAEVAGFGPDTLVLYGGSVKASNAAQILALPGVDGALVGGASLKAQDFLPIVRAAG